MNWPDRGRTSGYGMNILKGADQSLGTLFGIDCDELVSSWVGRNKAGKWQERVINWVFLHIAGERDHCKNSIEPRFL